MNFGEHLTIDGYDGSKEKLNSKEIVLGVLKNLPVKLGMHTLCDPQVFWAKENNIKDPGGWSGFVIIQESHISIHTFPGRRFLSADVYTCKNGLDIKKIITYIESIFEIKDSEINFIHRGTKYPEKNI